MERHTWRDRDEEGLIFYKACYHASRWTLESQRKGEEEWTRHDPVKREEWETLRDILYRKYQRKRCPWKLVEGIDKTLEKLAEERADAEGE